jgi:hypothetical protein
MSRSFSKTKKPPSNYGTRVSSRGTTHLRRSLTATPSVSDDTVPLTSGDARSYTPDGFRTGSRGPCSPVAPIPAFTCPGSLSMETRSYSSPSAKLRCFPFSSPSIIAKFSRGIQQETSILRLFTDHARRHTCQVKQNALLPAVPLRCHRCQRVHPKVIADHHPFIPFSTKILLVSHETQKFIPKIYTSSLS